VKSTAKGKRFRETLWFKKGQLASDEASKATAHATEPPAGAAELLPVEDRYLDDGSVTREDSRLYSVRTGKTQGVPLIREPAPERDKLDHVAPLVREMSWSRQRAAVIGAAVAALCAIVAVCVA